MFGQDLNLHCRAIHDHRCHTAHHPFNVLAGNIYSLSSPLFIPLHISPMLGTMTSHAALASRRYTGPYIRRWASTAKAPIEPPTNQ